LRPDLRRQRLAAQIESNQQTLITMLAQIE
jgi:hypothetical protein